MKTFEEQFPEFEKFKEDSMIYKVLIEQHCLSKQRVKEAKINLFLKFLFTTTDKNRTLKTIQIEQEDWEEFEKELGL